jgi:hypothetical protein
MDSKLSGTPTTDYYLAINVFSCEKIIETISFIED